MSVSQAEMPCFVPLADVHTFNALITAAPDVKEKYNEKWELIVVCDWDLVVKLLFEVVSASVCVCFVGSFEADGRAEGQAEPPDAERCPEDFETLWLSGQVSGLSCDQWDEGSLHRSVEWSLLIPASTGQKWFMIFWCIIDCFSLISDPSLASYNHVLSIFYKKGQILFFFYIYIYIY